MDCINCDTAKIFANELILQATRRFSGKLWKFSFRPFPYSHRGLWFKSLNSILPRSMATRAGLGFDSLNHFVHHDFAMFGALCGLGHQDALYEVLFYNIIRPFINWFEYIPWPRRKSCLKGCTAGAKCVCKCPSYLWTRTPAYPLVTYT